MFEFIIKMGLVTGGAVVAVTFCVVFYLAQPGKEISFWGVKLHKKWSRKKRISLRRLPSPLPEEWIVIFRAFADQDKPHLRDSQLFQVVRSISGFTEMKTREICAEMGKYGLVNQGVNYYTLSEKALPYVNEVNEQSV